MREAREPAPLHVSPTRPRRASRGGALAARVLLTAAVTLAPALASADEPSTSATPATPTDDGLSRDASMEEPDRTRLDVERLPPEAIRITRELYAHGIYVEGSIGGAGFLSQGVGRYLDPGPMLALRVGGELLDWLWVGALLEGSLHNTRAPAPPARTVVELLGASLDVRLQANPTPELALWLGGQAGLVVAANDVLSLYGQSALSSIGFMYGGDVGADFHFHARHLSLGIYGGARFSPSFDRPGELGVGVHGAASIRYVF